MKEKAVGILLLFIFSAALCQGVEVRVYKEKTVNKITTHQFLIQKTSHGFAIKLTSILPTNNKILQEFVTDSSYGTLTWTLQNHMENTMVSAKREGNKIFLSGIHKSKPINKMLKLKFPFWNQTFNLGLETIIKSGKKSMKFCAIGSSGPGDMKMGKFSMTRKDDETIFHDGKKIKTKRIKITLAGILSMFWQGKYWYRSSDGKFVRYQGKNGPGQPVSIMDLVSEKE